MRSNIFTLAIPSVCCFGVTQLRPRSVTLFPPTSSGNVYHQRHRGSLFVHATGDDDGSRESATTTKPPQSSSPLPQDGSGVEQPPVLTSSPWRIVLDIGREPLAVGMPFQWARSGTRMQLVILCDLRSDGTVVTRSDTVSFTGPGGAVERPIRGGSWELRNNNGNRNNKELSLSLVFPEYMERGDVWVDAGSTFRMEAAVFTKDQLDVLDQEFFQARDVTMRLDKDLKEMAQQRGAPRQWNEQSQRWESRPFDVGSFVTQMQKQVQRWGAQAKQSQANTQRPDRNTLSDQGSLPGVEGVIYIQEPGVVRLQKTDGIGGSAVMGKWTARPIQF